MPALTRQCHHQPNIFVAYFQRLRPASTRRLNGLHATLGTLTRNFDECKSNESSAVYPPPTLDAARRASAPLHPGFCGYLPCSTPPPPKHLGKRGRSTYIEHAHHPFWFPWHTMWQTLILPSCFYQWSIYRSVGGIHVISMTKNRSEERGVPLRGTSNEPSSSQPECLSFTALPLCIRSREPVITWCEEIGPLTKFVNKI